jgi:hypothetical protein
MRRTVILTIVVLVVVAPAVIGQDSAVSRAWYAYEQGNAAFARKEYGLALKSYKDAISIVGSFPEAEVGIGDIYRAEGEFGIAQAQYEKAYKNRRGFDVADAKYDVLYKLAYLFETQELYKQMEDRLGIIVSDDRHFAETTNSQLRTQVEKNYLRKGLDHALLLYSFSDAFALEAHAKLGWFYYRTGRYSPAVSHLLYATIGRVSQINAYLRDDDVDYQFTTLNDMLAKVNNHPELAEYVASGGLFKDLYYLAGATFATGYPAHAMTLWKLISGQAGAGAYQEMSRKQLRKPTLEPLLHAAIKGTKNN